jgi:serine/threonine protein kinase
LGEKNILHGDIKAENILLSEDYKPLLLDFGYSLRTNERCSRFIGDIRYASPEVIKHIEYTLKSEIYSLGILMFFLMTGHYPFAAAKVSDPNYRLLLEKKEEAFWERIQMKVKVHLSKDFKNVFMKMISSNPKNRCSL